MNPQITSEVEAAKSWLQKHERLIIALVAIMALVFLYNKVLNHEAARDSANAQVAAQTLKAQEAKDAQLAAEVAQSQQAYQTLVAQLTQQNSALAAAIQNRTVVVQQQQKADQVMSLPDLSARLTHLLGLQSTDVTPTTSGLGLSANAAYRATESLEEVPALKQDVTDLTTQNTNLKTELTASDNLSNQKDVQISNLNTTLSDKDKACKADLTAEKAKERRGKLHAFFYGLGVGAGAVAGIVIHAVI